MHVHTIFHKDTSTLTYVVFDEGSRDAVVIDPVLDFDPNWSRTTSVSALEVATFIREKALRLHWVLETHAHADHMSGSQLFKQWFDARVAIADRIRTVQAIFAPILDADLPTDGRPFDRLLGDHEVLEAGTLRITSLATPGHTPACSTYRVEDVAFTGDALFMPDSGVGRCDFPGGDADQLYTSVHERLFNLPDATRVFVGHDYQPGGRAVAFETTIGASKASNIHLRAETSRADFVAFRRGRDATLAAPRLLFPGIQVNVRAGQLPPPRANGRRFLSIPLDVRHDIREPGGAG